MFLNNKLCFLSPVTLGGNWSSCHFGFCGDYIWQLWQQASGRKCKHFIFTRLKCQCRPTGSFFPTWFVPRLLNVHQYMLQKYHVSFTFLKQHPTSFPGEMERYHYIVLLSSSSIVSLPSVHTGLITVMMNVGYLQKSTNPRISAWFCCCTILLVTGDRFLSLRLTRRKSPYAASLAQRRTSTS